MHGQCGLELFASLLIVEVKTLFFFFFFLSHEDQNSSYEAVPAYHNMEEQK